MKNKKSINDELNEFLELWDARSFVHFIELIGELYMLYDIDEEKDWLADKVNEEDIRGTRLARTFYVMSKLCDDFSGKIATTKVNFPKLWKRMEQISEESDII